LLLPPIILNSGYELKRVSLALFRGLWEIDFFLEKLFFKLWYHLNICHGGHFYSCCGNRVKKKKKKKKSQQKSNIYMLYIHTFIFI
jgi:hypothetical protein